MSEAEVKPTEAVPTAKPKNKGGRPRKHLPKGQNIVETKPVKHFPVSNWPSGRAIKIKIHKNQEEGEESGPWKLGDCPGLLIRRGVEVIVPLEIKSLLDDAVVSMPRTRWEGGIPVSQYQENTTRFEYSYFGEVPFEDYIKFRDGEKLKK
jgi:hypothetical protein